MIIQEQDLSCSFFIMSGIYIHIPFCKQACNYCDFHFSTSMKKKEDMVLAIAKEIAMRKNELEFPDSARNDNQIETIYFGGGTPSVLTNDEINFLISEVYKNYNVVDNPEITLKRFMGLFDNSKIRSADKSSGLASSVISGFFTTL